MKQARRNLHDLFRHLLVSVLAAMIAVGPAQLAFAGPVFKDKSKQPTPSTVTTADGQTRTVWTITAPNGAIFRYSSFDIAADEWVKFQQPSSTSRVLNKIDGSAPTKIDGWLSANGIVYIVNPAGVYFAKGSRIDVAGLQAAAGHMSDTDFQRGDDHYSGLKGKVQNDGAIGVRMDDQGNIIADAVSNAVALVGRNVANTGTINTDSWIVMAAGKDVFIGRDPNGNGLLLRVEGGADAVFNKKAVGVKNTGELTVQTPAEPNATGSVPTGRISLGAGDLYGTAIFNSGAIKAREIALRASNKGDVALGGDVEAETLGVTFTGDKTGKLLSTGSGVQLLDANTVNLTATGAKGQVVVGSDFLLRDPSGSAPSANVNVTQKANLQTSNLKRLQIGAGDERAKTAVSLTSTTGIDVDDKTLVSGTQLTLAAPDTRIHGTDALVVDRLDMQSRQAESDGDLVATGQDRAREVVVQDPNNPNDPNATVTQIVYDPVMNFIGNTTLTTKPKQAGDADHGTLVSALHGTLASNGDFITSDGGGLRIEAGDVKLGSLNQAGTALLGGSVLSSGHVASRVTITAAVRPEDVSATDTHLTGSVRVNSLDTHAAPLAPGTDQTDGGDITVDAQGDLKLFGDVLTQGGARPHPTDPRHDGGNVVLRTSGAGSTISVGNISTGGGDAPVAGAAEHGSILIQGANVVLKGNLDASADKNGNDAGQRNRSITVDGPVTLGADVITASGGAVEVKGAIGPGQKLSDPNDPNSPLVDRDVALGFVTNSLTLDGPVRAKSLKIDNTGQGPVLFGGNVEADDFVHVLFGSGGVSTWGTTAGAADPVVVTTHDAAVTASKSGSNGSVALDPNLEFELVAAKDPNDTSRPLFTFAQDAPIDEATTNQLFTPGRFVSGITDKTLFLQSNSSLTFAPSALGDVAGTNLKMLARSFSATGETFDVASFQLDTIGALKADFNVIAHGTADDQGIGIHSGATGVGGLEVDGSFQAHSILLFAGDGLPTDGSANGGSDAAIGFGSGVSFGGADGNKLDVFGLQQDASLTTANLPTADHFTGGAAGMAGMEYRLESLEGSVTLADQTAGKFANTDLRLNGQTGISLGATPLTLTGLVAKTAGSLDVESAIATTGAGGTIDLEAGANGLTVNAPLSADTIELSASGGGSAATGAVTLGTKAKFAGFSSDPNAPAAPTHFSLSQGASFDASILSPDDFAATIQGIDLALASLGGTLTVSSTNLVANTQLTLTGATGVNVALGGKPLELASLHSTSTTGATTFDGDVTTQGDLAITGKLVLDAPAVGSQPTAQTLSAGGALTVTGATAKSTDGDVVLESQGAVTQAADGTLTGGELTIGDVATAHTGGDIVLRASGKAKTGALDASGKLPDPNSPGAANPAVSVTGQSAVDIASISARGSAGTTGNDGGAGRAVVVQGASVRVGSVDVSGGKGGTSIGISQDTHGGDAGSITLTATGPTPQVGVSGNLLAVGGDGQTSGTTAAADLKGRPGDVTVNGSLLLDADSGSGPTSAIRGRNVAIHGNIGPGSVIGSDGTETSLDGSATGLTVVAGGTLAVDGSQLTAGLLDLQAHNGGLDLSNRTIHADTIRLAATDGAGGDKNQEVLLGGTQFMGADGTRRIVSLTIEQDKGFGGPDGSPIPDVNSFLGTSEPDEDARSLGLVTQDGTITLTSSDFPKVTGTQLTLAANHPDPTAPNPIQIDGGLALERLQLGTALGANGPVGGDADVNGSLAVTASGIAVEALRTYGNLHVKGDLAVKGDVRFAGVDSAKQVLDIDGVFDFGGADLSKTSTGDLEINASRIDLTADTAQSLSNENGQLKIDAPLVKGAFYDKEGDNHPDPNTLVQVDPNDVSQGFLGAGQRGLTLAGVSNDPNTPAVVVVGTTPVGGTTSEYSIAVANGDLSILTSSSQTAPAGGKAPTATYQLGGNVLVFGDIDLEGAGTFKGGKGPYTVEAQRNPFVLEALTAGGELAMGGVASADQSLHLIARGDVPTDEVQDPAAIHLSGDFSNLAGSLELDGTTDMVQDTTIKAAGDVTFDAPIQGAKNLTVSSQGQVALFDDVNMTAGALSLSGDKGVRFVSTDDTQTVQAGSISLGQGAAPAKSGAATLVRDGNLSLKATSGDVSIAKGQRTVVNGTLDVAAKRNIVLSDTAALRIKLASSELIVPGGATVMGNSIVSAARPNVSGATATFAVPTRTELSDNIPSDEILVRQIHPDGSPLSLAAAFAGSEGPNGEILFPTIPFPSVEGPALFDYSRVLAQPPLRYAVNRPHVDARELDASLADRPLWAEELLAYLEQRSLETPGVSESVEHLPPVGARPGEPIQPGDRRVRTTAAEQAVSLYRELFRPDVARDPETGYVDTPGRAKAIRDAFQGPVDVLRRGNKPVTGAALRDLIASSPSFAAAQGFGAQLGQLMAAGELALSPDQKPRFRALVLAQVVPYGIAPAEFETAVR